MPSVKLGYAYNKTEKRGEYYIDCDALHWAWRFWLGWHMAKRIKRKINLFPYYPTWFKIKTIGTWAGPSAVDTGRRVAKAIMNNEALRS